MGLAPLTHGDVTALLPQSLPLFVILMQTFLRCINKAMNHGSPKNKLCLRYPLEIRYLFVAQTFDYGIESGRVVKKGKFLYSAESSPQDHSKRFTLYFPHRSVHSYTISASLGSIQPYATINARRLLVHTSTTVYSQVLIYSAE